MDAIRVARGYTGREKIIKFEGGYHGHHDDVLVSIQPPRELMGPEDARPPCRQRRHPGQPAGGDGRRPVQPRRRSWRRSSMRTAARSPPSSSSRCSSTSASCRRCRASSSGCASWPRARRRAHLRRGQDRRRHRLRRRVRALRRQPDLFCLAKSIGGGIPIGAFGGARRHARHRGRRGGRRPVADRHRRATHDRTCATASRTSARTTATRCR